MNNNYTPADYSERVRTAWESRDKTKDYWELSQDIVALIIEEMVRDLPESIMLKMARLNGFDTTEAMVRSLKIKSS